MTDLEIETLKRFAKLGRWALTQTLGWECDIDVCDLQEEAQNCGLIKLAPGGYDPEKHDASLHDLEPERGDEWFEFSADAEIYDAMVKP